MPVAEYYVLRMPDNLPLDACAPLLCAGITLGHMGVKFAHALGAETTVLSQSLKKQSDGKRLGADHFHATSDQQTFARLQRHFDLIINTEFAALSPPILSRS